MIDGPSLSPLASRIESAELWTPGARVLAACSGGPDSLALLCALDELRRAGRLELISAHVHHGLRGPEADEDARHAAETAERFGIPHHERRRDAAGERAERRRGLEEAARQVRRDSLEQIRAETACNVIALAHTADDQAETMLLWLLRGAGPDGLSGMPARNGHFVRPLLSVRREELRQALLAAGLPWRSDATNWAASSARSLLREVVDRLALSFNERLVERLCETASLVREEGALIEAQAGDAADRLMESWSGADGAGPGARLAAGRAMEALPLPVARRLIRRFLRAARPDQPPPSFDATRRVLALATQRSGACRAVHVAGVVVRRVGEDLIAGAEIAWRPPEVPIPLAIPGRTRWGPDGSIVAEHVPLHPNSPELPPAREPREKGRSAACSQVLLDADRLERGLVVRTRRPGDAIFLPVSRLPRRTGEALAAIGVPAGLRDRHPLICENTAEGSVVWLVGQEPNPAHVITRQTNRVLRLRWEPALSRSEGAADGSQA